MISGIGSSNMASQLFSRLDTSNKGYLEKSDLASAFSKIASSNNSSDSTNVDDVFAALDSDSDGKVTESEFASTLAELQSNLQQSKMHGGGHGGPQGAGGMPPPPPQNDTGFTQDELQTQLDEIGSSDSQRASLISNIVNNFEAADTDGDGKVSFTEAMAYDQSSQASATSTSGTSSSSSSSSSTSTGSTSSSTASTSETDDRKIMHQIMQLMHAYGRPEQSTAMSTLLSTVA